MRLRNNKVVRIFHGVNLKPGRATMMGTMGDTFVMAMPGNPLATMLNVRMLSIPILQKLQGSNSYNHPFVYAKNSIEFKANPRKSNMVLGSIIDGDFRVTRDYRYGSGMLTPLMESDAIALLPQGKGDIADGEILKVTLLFSMH
jgi:molybdopterin molybdotransferase